MTTNRYGKILTIVLIILIVLILLGIGLIVYNVAIKPNRDKNKAMEAISEFDKNFLEEEEQPNENNEDITPTINPTENNQGTSGNNTPKKSYYNGFVMIGYITIPKTNVKQPILDSVTPEALNTAVALLYPTNAKLNEPGNVVIIGHNYRNGQFFSNNKKLSIGDKIYIKDTQGNEKAYTIYQKFETSEQDTSFYNRDTNGKAEVTLSTCTDDAKLRIIILARED